MKLKSLVKSQKINKILDVEQTFVYPNFAEPVLVVAAFVRQSNSHKQKLNWVSIFRKLSLNR